MLLQRHHRLFLLPLVAVCLGAWDRAPVSSADISKFTAPHFYVELEKDTAVMYEPIGIRFVVSNPAAENIVTLLPIASTPLERSMIKLQLKDSRGEEARWFGTQRNLLVPRKDSGPLSDAGVLAPGEQLSASYKLSLATDTVGVYKLSAWYQWRESPPAASMTIDEGKYTASNDATITITPPTGVDGDVVAYVGDSALLSALVDPLGTGKAPQVLQGRQNDVRRLRTEVLEKFPTSTYAEAILFAQASSLTKELGSDGSRAQSRANEALASWLLFFKRYPTSWYADEAMLLMADTQRTLGDVTAASQTARRLAASQSANPWLRERAQHLVAELESGR